MFLQFIIPSSNSLLLRNFLSLVCLPWWPPDTSTAVCPVTTNPYTFSAPTPPHLPAATFFLLNLQHWPNFKLVCLDPFWLLHLILGFWTAISSSSVMSPNNIIFFLIPVTIHWLILHWHLVANTEQVTFISSQFRARRHADVNTYLLSFHLFSFLCMSDFSYASSRFFRIWTCPFHLYKSYHSEFCKHKEGATERAKPKVISIFHLPSKESRLWWTFKYIHTWKRNDASYYVSRSQ